ncbi:Longitudinals lacking protein-like [Amphibalanus amphitrite]|uniref:Longitudinals lacking protein-like n=1 Tax=Amphibalanus amphitrite TaxID=1232801 RepID=A0A6A4X7G0_AMPAM|nr:Longitudinals lacking protein-like [Amphibalanus amphitrite]
MSDQQEFCLRWNDFHSSFHLSLEALRGDESFTDVTLSCSGRLMRAHRVILSACSVHFKEILRAIPPQQHPVIVLPTVDYDVMQAILEFIYQGQVNVRQSQLGAFLQVAETFSIQGLADDETKRNAAKAPLLASEADVMKAINSFPPSSSAGLDGIRPAHLRSLLTKHTAEAGARLLTALTALTNLALSGRLPECVVPAFFGASLIALRKKDGGLRPIAVGSVYRRIAGKVAAAAVSGAIGARLRPIQLGVATRNGYIREVAMNELELLGAPVHDDQVRRKLQQGQRMVEKLIRRLQALEEAH